MLWINGSCNRCRETYRSTIMSFSGGVDSVDLNHIVMVSDLLTQLLSDVQSLVYPCGTALCSMNTTVNV